MSVSNLRHFELVNFGLILIFLSITFCNQPAFLIWAAMFSFLNVLEPCPIYVNTVPCFLFSSCLLTTLGIFTSSLAAIVVD